MRGKHVLMDTLEVHGIDLLFGNPGTTESPLIDVLVDRPRLRYIMALHESVALGAAHYYAQATGKTGVVSLHVAPGLGNALGMLYNAWEANSPLLVTAGQQDTRMRLREPLLGHDLPAMAAPLVKWSAQV
jgi:benzoylformate decarboxylase